MTAFWRRSAESATGFARKFREDLYFRTEVSIIALQIAFTAFVLVLFVIGFSVLYHQLVTDIGRWVLENLTSPHTAASAPAITKELEYLRDKNLIIIGAVVLGGAAVFGYLVANVTLRPTKNALEAQKQFIGNVAHEHRTPLAIIKTNTEVELLDTRLSEETRRMHKSNIEELDRISNIINNLLSLSVIVRPEQAPFRNVNLGTVVDTVVARLRELAETKRIAIEVTKSEECTVWGNESALEEIVMNVLKNALNYTSTGGGAVKAIISSGHEDTIELTVEDSGRGIPPEDLSRIFEPFYRGTASRTRGEGGSGLGLTIVNELLRLHNAKMSIRSAPGRGTTVLISLPRGKKDLPKEDRIYEEVAIDFGSKR